MADAKGLPPRRDLLDLAGCTGEHQEMAAAEGQECSRLRSGGAGAPALGWPLVKKR